MNTFAVSDAHRLITDVRVVVELLCPDIDVKKLIVRLEEVVSNYSVERKSQIDIEYDLEDNINMFLDAMRLEGLSEKTLKNYKYILNEFAEYSSKPTAQIKTAHIRSYLSSNNNITMSTVATKLSTLKSFFSWLVREEIILRDPTLKIKPPKLPKRLPKALSVEELELVRESCTSLRQRALVEVLYATGCRLSELANMKKDDINLQNMSVKVIGKGNKERIVYLSFKALYHLQKYLNTRNDDCEYLFTTERKPHRRLGERAIQLELARLNRKLKLSNKLSPHVLRHTLANNLLNNGADLADVQAILGHEDPGTTLNYSRVTEERKKQAFNKYHIQ